MHNLRFTASRVVTPYLAFAGNAWPLFVGCIGLLAVHPSCARLGSPGANFS